MLVNGMSIPFMKFLLFSMFNMFLYTNTLKRPFDFVIFPHEKTAAACSGFFLKKREEGGNLCKRICACHSVLPPMPVSRANMHAASSSVISPRRAIISTPYMPMPAIRWAKAGSPPRSIMPCATIFSTAGPI